MISFPLIPGNIFVTYSVDTALEMVPFVDFLTKQGFRPAVSDLVELFQWTVVCYCLFLYLLIVDRARGQFHLLSFFYILNVMAALVLFSQIDLFDNQIRRMDINKWMDSYLKDVRKFTR